MDEHRVGLKPVIRRIWVDELAVPIANVNWRFQWLWLYAFVHPKSGQTYWWILPYVNIELFNRVLENFARHFGRLCCKNSLRTDYPPPSPLFMQPLRRFETRIVYEL